MGATKQRRLQLCEWYDPYHSQHHTTPYAPMQCSPHATMLQLSSLDIKLTPGIQPTVNLHKYTQ